MSIWARSYSELGDPGRRGGEEGGEVDGEGPAAEEAAHGVAVGGVWSGAQIGECPVAI